MSKVKVLIWTVLGFWSAAALACLCGCATTARNCTVVGLVTTAQQQGEPATLNYVIVAGVRYVKPQTKLCDDGTIRWEGLPEAREK